MFGSQWSILFSPPSYPHIWAEFLCMCKVVKCSTVNYAPSPAIFSFTICTCRLCHIIMIIISEIRKACKGPAKENEQTLCSREKEIWRQGEKGG